MQSVPSSAPVPALSNRLADLAERAGEAARRYRRGSIESIREYLTAGELLAEARGECRRGEWGAVLKRAGIADRTGRLMVQAWRIARDSGASAETVHDAGGIQAFVAAAVEAAGAAVEAAARALDAGDVADEKPALNAGIEGEPAGDVGDDAPVGGSEGRSEPFPGSEPVAVPPSGHSGALAGSEGRTGGFRARRRARGECADCGASSGTAYRCPPCAARHRAAAGRATDHARIGRALAKRIRAAAGRGAGLRLSAGDVAGLVAGEGKAYRARLAKLGRRG